MKIIGHPKLTHDRDGFIDGTVKEIDELLGGDFEISSEERKNSSELRNHSSEVSLLASVKDSCFPRSYLGFPRLSS